MSETETEPYRTDPERMQATLPPTGIHVRALSHLGGEDRWIPADIVDLDRESLTRWLRSRGGENEWAESVVAMLLGHDR